MAHPRTNPGGHVLFNQGEKLIETDLERMGEMHEQTVLHLVARLLQGSPPGNPVTGFPGDDCRVSVVGLTATVAAGWGLYYESAETSAWKSHWKPIVLSAPVNQVVNAHDATYPRNDLICLAPATLDDQNATRNVKDLTSGAISSQVVPKRRRWSYSLQYVPGAAVGAVASDPAVPVGYIAVARLRVPAGAGTPAVDDLRPRLALTADMASEPPSEYASNFVPGSGTELEVAASSPAAMSVLVRDGSAVILGARYRYGRQTLTLTAAHATLARTDTVVADADGTLKVLAGTPGGAPAPVATSQVSLATVLVGAAVTSIVSGNITGARPRQPYDGSVHLRNGSVTTAKIGDSAVTTAKINDAAVTTAKIEDGAVTAAKLSSYPIKVTPTLGGPEAGNAFTVEIQAEDLDGNNHAAVSRMALQVVTASGDALVSGTQYTVTLGAAGTEVLPSNAPSTSARANMVVDSNASGHVQAIVTDVVTGASRGVWLLVTPLDPPGFPALVSLGFN